MMWLFSSSLVGFITTTEIYFELCAQILEDDFNGLNEGLDPNRAQCARDQIIQNNCEFG